MKKIFLVFIALAACLIVTLTGCAKDPYKDYLAAGIQAKGIDYGYDDVYNSGFGYDRAELFTSYESYAAYNFNLGYTESYFELNDLLVWVVSCCTSDGMEFHEILSNEGKLYPLFYRNEIKDGQDVTTDFIIMSFCAEVAKSENYGLGEIIYEYK